MEVCKRHGGAYLLGAGGGLVVSMAWMDPQHLRARQCMKINVGNL